MKLNLLSQKIWFKAIAIILSIILPLTEITPVLAKSDSEIPLRAALGSSADVDATGRMRDLKFRLNELFIRERILNQLTSDKIEQLQKVGFGVAMAEAEKAEVYTRAEGESLRLSRDVWFPGEHDEVDEMVRLIWAPLKRKEDILLRQEAVRQIISLDSAKERELINLRANASIWLLALKNLLDYPENSDQLRIEKLVKRSDFSEAKISTAAARLEKARQDPDRRDHISEEDATYVDLDFYRSEKNAVKKYAERLAKFSNPILQGYAHEIIQHFEAAAFPDLTELIRLAQAGDSKKLGEIRESLKGALKESMNRAGAFITFAQFAKQDEFQKAAFDENKPVGYKRGWLFTEPKKARSFDENKKDQVSNDSPRDLPAVVLTGSNMSGKSHYLKQNFFIQLLAQSFGYVPAEAANLRIYDQIVYLDRPSTDSFRNLSAFLKEIENWKPPLEAAGARSIFFADEGYSTTSSEDQDKLLLGTSRYLASRGSKIFLAAHNENFIEAQEKNTEIGLYHFEVKIQGKDITFTYVLKEGADDSHALEVAEALGLQERIIKRAKRFLEKKEAPVAQIHTPKIIPIKRYTEGERAGLKNKIGDFLRFFPNDDANDEVKTDSTRKGSGALNWRYGKEDGRGYYDRPQKKRKPYSHDPLFSLFSHDADFSQWSPVTQVKFGKELNPGILRTAQQMLMQGGSRDPREIYERQRMFQALAGRSNFYETDEILTQMNRLMFVMTASDHEKMDYSRFNLELLEHAAYDIRTDLFHMDVKGLKFDLFFKVLEMNLRLNGLTLDQIGIKDEMERLEQLLALKQEGRQIHLEIYTIELGKIKRKEWLTKLKAYEEKVAHALGVAEPDDFVTSKLEPTILSTFEAVAAKAKEKIPAVNLLDRRQWDEVRKELAALVPIVENEKQEKAFLIGQSRRDILNLAALLSERDLAGEFVKSLRSFDSVNLHQLANYFEKIMGVWFGGFRSGTDYLGALFIIDANVKASEQKKEKLEALVEKIDAKDPSLSAATLVEEYRDEIEKQMERLEESRTRREGYLKETTLEESKQEARERIREIDEELADLKSVMAEGLSSSTALDILKRRLFIPKIARLENAKYHEENEPPRFDTRAFEMILGEFQKWQALEAIAFIVKQNAWQPVELTEDLDLTTGDGWSFLKTKEEQTKQSVHFGPGERVRNYSGPNGSGKTFSIKALIWQILAAQTTGFAPAARMRLPVFDRVIYLDRVTGQWDRTLSSFGEETKYWKQFFNLTDRSRLVFAGVDEAGSTTSPRYQSALSYAIGEDMLENGHFLAMASHSHEYLTRFENTNSSTSKTYHFKTDIQDREVKYSYEIAPGHALSNGVAIAERFGLGMVTRFIPSGFGSKREEKTQPRWTAEGLSNWLIRSEHLVDRPDIVSRPAFKSRVPAILEILNGSLSLKQKSRRLAEHFKALGIQKAEALGNTLARAVLLSAEETSGTKRVGAHVFDPDALADLFREEKPVEKDVTEEMVGKHPFPVRVFIGPGKQRAFTGTARPRLTSPGHTVVRRAHENGGTVLKNNFLFLWEYGLAHSRFLEILAEYPREKIVHVLQSEAAFSISERDLPRVFELKQLIDEAHLLSPGMAIRAIVSHLAGEDGSYRPLVNYVNHILTNPNANPRLKNTDPVLPVQNKDEITGLDLWGVKIGQITEVYRAEVSLKNRPAVRFVINTATDLADSARLVEQAFKLLKENFALYPDLAMEPFGLGKGKAQSFRGEEDVPVLVGEWLEGFEELRVEDDTAPLFGFFTNLHSTPAAVMNEEESNQVWSEITRIRTILSRIEEDGRIVNQTHINNGDFVARRSRDGKWKALLVWSAEENSLWKSDPGAALTYAMLEIALSQNMSLSGKQMPLFWGKPALAIAAAKEAFFEKKKGSAAESAIEREWMSLLKHIYEASLPKLLKTPEIFPGWEKFQPEDHEIFLNQVRETRRVIGDILSRQHSSGFGQEGEQDKEIVSLKYRVIFAAAFALGALMIVLPMAGYLYQMIFLKPGEPLLQIGVFLFAFNLNLIFASVVAGFTLYLTVANHLIRAIHGRNWLSPLVDNFLKLVTLLVTLNIPYLLLHELGHFVSRCLFWKGAAGVIKIGLRPGWSMEFETAGVLPTELTALGSKLGFDGSLLVMLLSGDLAAVSVLLPIFILAGLKSKTFLKQSLFSWTAFVLSLVPFNYARQPQTVKSDYWLAAEKLSGMLGLPGQTIHFYLMLAALIFPALTVLILFTPLKTLMSPVFKFIWQKVWRAKSKAAEKRYKVTLRKIPSEQGISKWEAARAKDGRVTTFELRPSISEGSGTVFLSSEGNDAGSYSYYDMPDFPDIHMISVRKQYRGTGAIDVIFEDIIDRLAGGNREAKFSVSVTRKSSRAKKGSFHGKTIPEIKDLLGVMSETTVIPNNLSGFGVAAGLMDVIQASEWLVSGAALAIYASIVFLFFPFAILDLIKEVIHLSALQRSIRILKNPQAAGDKRLAAIRRLALNRWIKPPLRTKKTVVAMLTDHEPSIRSEAREILFQYFRKKYESPIGSHYEVGVVLQMEKASHEYGEDLGEYLRPYVESALRDSPRFLKKRRRSYFFQKAMDIFSNPKRPVGDRRLAVKAVAHMLSLDPEWSWDTKISEASKDEDAEVRRTAVQAMRELMRRKKVARPSFFNTVGFDYMFEGEHTIDAAGIISALGDPDAQVRQTATLALASAFTVDYTFNLDNKEILAEIEKGLAAGVDIEEYFEPLEDALLYWILEEPFKTALVNYHYRLDSKPNRLRMLLHGMNQLRTQYGSSQRAKPKSLPELFTSLPEIDGFRWEWRKDEGENEIIGEIARPVQVSTQKAVAKFAAPLELELQFRETFKQSLEDAYRVPLTSADAARYLYDLKDFSKKMQNPKFDSRMRQSLRDLYSPYQIALLYKVALALTRLRRYDVAGLIESKDKDKIIRAIAELREEATGHLQSLFMSDVAPDSIPLSRDPRAAEEIFGNFYKGAMNFELRADEAVHSWIGEERSVRRLVHALASDFKSGIRPKGLPVTFHIEFEKSSRAYRKLYWNSFKAGWFKQGIPTLIFMLAVGMASSFFRQESAILGSCMVLGIFGISVLFSLGMFIKLGEKYGWVFRYCKDQLIERVFQKNREQKLLESFIQKHLPAESEVAGVAGSAHLTSVGFGAERKEGPDEMPDAFSEKSEGGRSVAEDDILQWLTEGQEEELLPPKITAGDIYNEKVGFILVKPPLLQLATQALKRRGFKIVYQGMPQPNFLAMENSWAAGGPAQEVIPMLATLSWSGNAFDILRRLAHEVNAVHVSGLTKELLDGIYIMVPHYEIFRVFDMETRGLVKEIPLSPRTMVEKLKWQIEEMSKDLKAAGRPLVIFSMIPAKDGKAYFDSFRLDVAGGHSYLRPRFDIQGEDGIRGALGALDESTPLILKIPVHPGSHVHFPARGVPENIVYTNALIDAARMLMSGGMPPRKPVLTDSPENLFIREPHLIDSHTTLDKLASLPLRDAQGNALSLGIPVATPDFQTPLPARPRSVIDDDRFWEQLVKEITPHSATEPDSPGEDLTAGFGAADLDNRSQKADDPELVRFKDRLKGIVGVPVRKWILDSKDRFDIWFGGSRTLEDRLALAKSFAESFDMEQAGARFSVPGGFAEDFDLGENEARFALAAIHFQDTYNLDGYMQPSVGYYTEKFEKQYVDGDGIHVAEALDETDLPYAAKLLLLLDNLFRGHPLLSLTLAKFSTGRSHVRFAKRKYSIDSKGQIISEFLGTSEGIVNHVNVPLYVNESKIEWESEVADPSHSLYTHGKPFLLFNRLVTHEFAHSLFFDAQKLLLPINIDRLRVFLEKYPGFHKGAFPPQDQMEEFVVDIAKRIWGKKLKDLARKKRATHGLRKGRPGFTATAEEAREHFLTAQSVSTPAPGEYLAEAISLFWLDPNYVRERDPITYDFISAILNLPEIDLAKETARKSRSTGFGAGGGTSQSKWAPRRVMIVENDSNFAAFYKNAIAKQFTLSDESVITTPSAEGAMTLTEQFKDIDLIMLDNDLDGEIEGHQIIPILRMAYPGAVIIFNSARTDLTEKIHEGGLVNYVAFPKISADSPAELHDLLAGFVELKSAGNVRQEETTGTEAPADEESLLRSLRTDHSMPPESPEEKPRRKYEEPGESETEYHRRMARGQDAILEKMLKEEGLPAGETLEEKAPELTEEEHARNVKSESDDFLRYLVKQGGGEVDETAKPIFDLEDDQAKAESLAHWVKKSTEQLQDQAIFSNILKSLRSEIESAAEVPALIAIGKRLFKLLNSRFKDEARIKAWAAVVSKAGRRVEPLKSALLKIINESDPEGELESIPLEGGEELAVDKKSYAFPPSVTDPDFEHALETIPLEEDEKAGLEVSEAPPSEQAPEAAEVKNISGTIDVKKQEQVRRLNHDWEFFKRGWKRAKRDARTDTAVPNRTIETLRRQAQSLIGHDLTEFVREQFNKLEILDIVSVASMGSETAYYVVTERTGAGKTDILSYVLTPVQISVERFEKKLKLKEGSARLLKVLRVKQFRLDGEKENADALSGFGAKRSNESYGARRLRNKFLKRGISGTRYLLGDASDAGAFSAGDSGPTSLGVPAHREREPRRQGMQLLEFDHPFKLTSKLTIEPYKRHGEDNKNNTPGNEKRQAEAPRAQQITRNKRSGVDGDEINQNFSDIVFLSGSKSKVDYDEDINGVSIKSKHIYDINTISTGVPIIGEWESEKDGTTLLITDNHSEAERALFHMPETMRSAIFKDVQNVMVVLPGEAEEAWQLAKKIARLLEIHEENAHGFANYEELGQEDNLMLLRRELFQFGKEEHLPPIIRHLRSDNNVAIAEWLVWLAKQQKSVQVSA